MRAWLSGAVARLTSQHGLGAVLAEGFLARLAFSVISFALPFYAISLGMSLTEAGILAAMRVIIALAMKPVMGVAADRFGAKAVYLASIAGRSVVALLFLFAATPLTLFLVRALHGVTTAARDPTSALLLMEHADEKRVASAFSWYATAKTAGAAIGFPIAGLLLAYSGDNYALVFLFAAVVSALALPLIWRHVKSESRPSAVQSADVRTSDVAPQGAAVSMGNWKRYALLAALVALPASMVSGLFPLIVAETANLGKAEIGFVYAVATVVTIIAGPMLGWLADHVSRNGILAVRSIANVASSILYLSLPGFWGMAAARIVDDTGKAAFAPAWGSIMAELAREEEKAARGKRVSMLDTAESIGEAMGPVLAGALWQYGGLAYLFAARIVLAIGAEIYAVRILRQRFIKLN